MEALNGLPNEILDFKASMDVPFGGSASEDDASPTLAIVDVLPLRDKLALFLREKVTVLT